MRIHVLSDLHLEFAEYTPAVTDADVTILAGDIHTKARGVQWAREVFAGRVLYVPGNHEFYKGHLTQTLEKMRAQACARVQVLEQNEVVIEGVRFLGTTGWTDFRVAQNPYLSMLDARQQMNDYRYIRHKAWHKLRPEDTQAAAVAARSWLQQQLAEPFAGPTVVITHHAPSTESLGTRVRGGGLGTLDACYANAWEDLFGEQVLWIHGHTHRAADYTLLGTRVVANPRGYPGEEVAGFNSGLVLEL